MSEEEFFDTHFVTVSAEATVGQALALLREQASADGWHIVVDRGDGKYQVIQVKTLRERWFNWIGAKLFDLQLTDLPELVEAHTIARSEASQYSPKYLRRKAREESAHLFLITEQDQLVGRVWAGGEKEMFPAANMGQLYGEFIDTHVDARSRWRPQNVPPPVCPHCENQGYFRYQIEDNGLYCSNCQEFVRKRG